MVARPKQRVRMKAGGQTDKKYIYPNFYSDNFDHKLLHACQQVSRLILDHVKRTDQFLNKKGLKALIRDVIKGEHPAESKAELLKVYNEYYVTISKHDPSVFVFWNFFYLYVQSKEENINIKLRTRSWKMIVQYLSDKDLIGDNKLLKRVHTKYSQHKDSDSFHRKYNDFVERNYVLHLSDLTCLSLFRNIMDMVDPLPSTPDLDEQPEETKCGERTTEYSSEDYSSDDGDLSPVDQDTSQRRPPSKASVRDVTLIIPDGPGHNSRQEIVSNILETQTLLDSIQTLKELNKLFTEQLKDHLLRKKDLEQCIARAETNVVNTRRSLIRMLIQLYQTESDPEPYAAQVRELLEDPHGIGIQLVDVPVEDSSSGDSSGSEVVDITHTVKKRKVGHSESNTEKNLKNPKEEASTPVKVRTISAPAPTVPVTSTKKTSVLAKAKGVNKITEVPTKPLVVNSAKPSGPEAPLQTPSKSLTKISGTNLGSTSSTSSSSNISCASTSNTSSSSSNASSSSSNISSFVSTPSNFSNISTSTFSSTSGICSSSVFPSVSNTPSIPSTSTTSTIIGSAPFALPPLSPEEHQKFMLYFYHTQTHQTSQQPSQSLAQQPLHHPPSPPPALPTFQPTPTPSSSFLPTFQPNPVSVSQLSSVHQPVQNVLSMSSSPVHQPVQNVLSLSSPLLELDSPIFSAEAEEDYFLE